MSRTISTRFPQGTLIGGRYEVTDVLGWGGMAEVLLAQDHRLGRAVAVKVLRDPLAGDDRFLARFRREARTVAALDDPRIVALHDVGVHDGRPFLVMEHVPGRTLTELLREEGPVPPLRAAAIGEAVAAALATAHAAGIVHRDVKPGNVIVTRGGGVKVLDFGIARALRWTPLTDTPAVHGTPEYVSPEQARGEEVDGRSDIYSLGVVLYELLAGRPPFTGDSPLAVAYKHLEESPPPLDALRPDVPPALATVVMRCLAKRPSDRYRRAAELRADLARLLGGEPPATAPLPSGGGTRRLPRSPQGDAGPRPPRPGVRWPAAVAVLALAANLAVAATLFQGRPDPVSAARPRPLHPPTAVEAEGACGGFLEARATVSWSPSASPFADGYEVYRGSASGGPYERVGVVSGVRTTAFQDAGLDPGVRYFYVVKAIAGTRTSAPSGQAQAETPTVCLW